MDRLLLLAAQGKCSALGDLARLPAPQQRTVLAALPLTTPLGLYAHLAADPDWLLERARQIAAATGDLPGDTLQHLAAGGRTLPPGATQLLETTARFDALRRHLAAAAPESSAAIAELPYEAFQAFWERGEPLEGLPVGPLELLGSGFAWSPPALLALSRALPGPAAERLHLVKELNYRQISLRNHVFGVARQLRLSRASLESIGLEAGTPEDTAAALDTIRAAVAELDTAAAADADAWGILHRLLDARLRGYDTCALPN